MIIAVKPVRAEAGPGAGGVTALAGAAKGVAGGFLLPSGVPPAAGPPGGVPWELPLPPPTMMSLRALGGMVLIAGVAEQTVETEVQHSFLSLFVATD